MPDNTMTVMTHLVFFVSAPPLPVYGSAAGGVHFGNLTPEEAEALFRRAFGGISLEEILRQAFNQSSGARWAGRVPYQRQEAFEHRMGSRPSTSFLDDGEIFEILKGFSGKVMQRTRDTPAPPQLDQPDLLLK